MQSQSHHVNGSSSGSGAGELAEVKKEATKVTKKLNEINDKLEMIESQTPHGLRHLVEGQPQSSFGFL